jgi:hypothetical protein
MVCSDRIPAIPHNRKLLEFRSDHSAEVKTTRHPVPWNKSGSKLSEFCFKAFADENTL